MIQDIWANLSVKNRKNLPCWASHVLLPRVTPRFTAATGCLFSTKGSANLSSISWNVYIHYATITAMRPTRNWNEWSINITASNIFSHKFSLRSEFFSSLSADDACKLQTPMTHPIHVKIASGLHVKIELLSPCGTELFKWIASSRLCKLQNTKLLTKSEK